MAQRLAEQVEKHLSLGPAQHLGVAVSGGGDSMALLLVLRGIALRLGLQLSCITVDHGLRAASRAEAKMVAQQCSAIGIEHHTLTWTGWDGTGNLQDAARRARYGLMGEWARHRGVDCIALGHTQDDQAETVLMRLARGAGVDGLSAMSVRRVSDGVVWLRPLLAVSRTDLRDFLREEGATWIEDPSNEDETYDRIKARRVLDHLAELGIERATLAQVAYNMRQARGALEQQTRKAAQDIGQARAGGLELDWVGFQDQPADIQRRLLIGAIGWICAPLYAPRGRAVETVVEALHTGSSATLEGCHFRVTAQRLWIFREYNAVRALRSPLNAPWDGRWCVTGSVPAPDFDIAALGETGLLLCPDWRATGLPRDLLLGTPAIWRGQNLIAAPLAQSDCPWRAEAQNRGESCFAAVIAH